MPAKYVLVDIDGTVADMSELQKYFETDPIDWDNYFKNIHKCKPIKNIIKLVEDLNHIGYMIIFITARGEEIREQTDKWLMKYLPNIEYDLVMREAKDMREDSVVKLELFKELTIKKEDVFLVIDDRDSVVKMWREQGFTCLQPNYGDF